MIETAFCGAGFFCVYVLTPSPFPPWLGLRAYYRPIILVPDDPHEVRQSIEAFRIVSSRFSYVGKSSIKVANTRLFAYNQSIDDQT